MISLAVLDHAQPALRARDRAHILREAEVVCFEDLAAAPDQPARLHLRGLLALRQRQTAFAVACLSRAVALDPSKAIYHADLADALGQAGAVADAIRACEQAVWLGGPDPGLHRSLARLLVREGRYAEAMTRCDAALQAAPDCAQAHCARGDALRAQRRFADAGACYARGLQIDPASGDACLGLARAHAEAGGWPLAIATCRDGLRLHPRLAELRALLGEGLLRVGSLDEAAEALRAALAVRPGHVQAAQRLATALECLGRHDDAVGAWFCLGEALENEDRLAEAEAVYRHVATSDPRHLKAHLGLGYLHLQRGQARRAIPHFDAALALRPRHAQARLARGRAAALTSDLSRHWKETRWFERHGPRPRRYFTQPEWEGDALDGKTVLLWANDTVAHTLQMVRFAQVVQARGGRAVVECQREVLPLVRRATGVDAALARRTVAPTFDRQVSLTSLPCMLDTTLATIPARVPYLSVEPPIANRWRTRLGRHRDLIVGLRWASELDRAHPGVRSVPLAVCAPLAGVSGVRFVCLQDWPQIAELVAPPPGLRVERVLDVSPALIDLAGIVSCLDLVIAVDSLVAHLAGALARPVWTLVPACAPWYWHGGEQASPWYPTMRLFRQTARGDWRDVLQRVRVALDALVQVRREIATA